MITFKIFFGYLTHFPLLSVLYSENTQNDMIKEIYGGKFMNKKLYRSRTKRALSGVCGGLEDYFEIDVTIIRLVWVLISIMSGGFPGVVAYVIAVFIIPEQPVGYRDDDIKRTNTDYKVNEEDENK